MLTILICTIEERQQSFEFIYNKLQEQIDRQGLSKSIKIDYLCDKKGEKSIGEKRNILLQRCKTKYACFIDDDDDVYNYFIEIVNKGIKKNKDCLSLKGEISIDGGQNKVFIHSIKYKSYFQDERAYYRPPNHLNVIKTAISKKFMFPEKSFGEDTDWAMDICNSGMLKTEHHIEEVLYLYRYVSSK